MAEPDGFISTFDEHGNTLDVPYPRENGLPMHPSAIINLHNAGNLPGTLVRTVPASTAVLLLYVAQDKSITDAGSITYDNLAVRLNDIYRPLMDVYLSTSSMHRGPYPSPPSTRKRPASVPGPQESPTKHLKRIRTRHSTVAPATSAPVKTNTPLPGVYSLPAPFGASGELPPDASDDELVSFFMELNDATIELKGIIVYDETMRSKGIFTRSSIDIEVLIEQLQYTIFSEAQNEEHARRKLIQDQQELRFLLKDIKGAGVGPNNEMIAGPSAAFFAIGEKLLVFRVYNSYDKLSIGTKDDPIDVDDVEVCADCSQEIDSNIHKDLCLGTYEVE
ncbi:uncharacterized protein C8R40DRAFT_1168595 [Lentinula edodes]|uniref:uncharacterized protein n=1 Tax=Lentinula edodes TaxID=5353 RepID=UPI001E8E26FD|nr:uncharacterized protein C8R40DRAFT_1168595 [Lentinula edodes]KAH7877270.1 hypothetical protein C8R40DRAFT_1168595 [Lentinula edodes]